MLRRRVPLAAGFGRQCCFWLGTKPLAAQSCRQWHPTSARYQVRGRRIGSSSRTRGSRRYIASQTTTPKMAGAQRMYAKGVRSLSPGSRVCERTLGNGVRGASTLKGSHHRRPQTVMKPFQGMEFIIDCHPGCARRLATLGYDIQRLQRKKSSGLETASTFLGRTPPPTSCPRGPSRNRRRSSCPCS